jgi:hypothetical protein
MVERNKLCDIKKKHTETEEEQKRELLILRIVVGCLASVVFILLITLLMLNVLPCARIKKSVTFKDTITKINDEENERTPLKNTVQ